DGYGGAAGLEGNEGSRRAVQDTVAHLAANQSPAVGVTRDAGGQDLLAAAAVGVRGGDPPDEIDPLMGRGGPVVLQGLEAGSQGGYPAFSFHGGADDAPGLAGLNPDTLHGVVRVTSGAARSRARVAGGVLAIALGAASEQVPLIDRLDVARPLDKPLDL